MTMTASSGLSPAQQLQLHQQGFLGPFRLWEKHETAQMRDMLEEYYLRNPDNSVPSNNRFLKHPEIIELLRRPSLTDRMASMLGEDLFLWRIGAFIKQPGNELSKREVPWHQDRNYWPLEPALVCSAWLAVDDVDVENSALHFIPGSHRQMIPHIPALASQAFLERADPAHFNVTEAVAMELKAGEFVLFNERLLHWSKPHTSKRRRFGLAIRVLPPQVRVMDYDCDEHALAQLRGSDPLKFNRLLK